MSSRQIIALGLVLLASLQVRAQQAQIDEWWPQPYEYPTFREAIVSMRFGSKKVVQGNIYLYGSKFYFINRGRAIEAALGNVRSITIGDSTYLPIDTIVARVVAQDSTKMLLCVHTIDTKRMKGHLAASAGDDKNSEGLPYVNIEGLGILEQNDTEEREKSKMFPLKREYYYMLDGQLIRAKEGTVMRRYSKEERKRLKQLTENRHWSWHDEQSLAALLLLL